MSAAFHNDVCLASLFGQEAIAKDPFALWILAKAEHDRRIPQAMDGSEMLPHCIHVRKQQRTVPKCIIKAMDFAHIWERSTPRNAYTYVDKDAQIQPGLRWLTETDRHNTLTQKERNLQKIICVGVILEEDPGHGFFGKVCQIVLTIWRRTLILKAKLKSEDRPYMAKLFDSIQSELKTYTCIGLDASKSCFKLAEIGFPVRLVNVNAMGFYFEAEKIKARLQAFLLSEQCPHVLRDIQISVVYAPSPIDLQPDDQKGTSIRWHTALCEGWHTFVYYVAACSAVPLVGGCLAASGPRPRSVERSHFSNVWTGFCTEAFHDTARRLGLANSLILPALRREEESMETDLSRARLVFRAAAADEGAAMTIPDFWKPSAEPSNSLIETMATTAGAVTDQEQDAVNSHRSDDHGDSVTDLEPELASAGRMQAATPPTAASFLNMMEKVWLLMVPVYASTTVLFDKSKDEVTWYKVIVRQKGADDRWWLGNLHMRLRGAEEGWLLLGFKADVGSEQPFVLRAGNFEIVSVQPDAQEHQDTYERKKVMMLNEIACKDDSRPGIINVPLSSIFIPLTEDGKAQHRDREVKQITSAMQECRTLSKSNPKSGLTSVRHV